MTDVKPRADGEIVFEPLHVRALRTLGIALARLVRRVLPK
jgi:hypothetical protein